MKPQILLVDDDLPTRFGFNKYLTKVGYEVREASTLHQAQEAVSSQRFDALLLDLLMPDGNGLDWVPVLRANYPDLPIIIITGAGDLPMAVEAMRKGADNFLTKPVDMAGLEVFLQKILEVGTIRRRHYSEQRLFKKEELYFGQSQTIQKVRELAILAAETDSAVLLQGESGVGKGMLAQWIHYHSRRSSNPFVEINCSGLRGDLLSSELFGAVRGAFTSAVQDRSGLIEVADRGSLFLDEVGDMELNVQAQFLKVIEEKTFRRLGDVKPRRSDFRLICATHKDLQEEIAHDRFRKELYFRIHVFPIMLPPLRERPEDIPDLVSHILATFGASGTRVSPEVLGLLITYPWPGNIRELRNVLERACLLAKGKPLEPIHFPGLEIPASGPESRKKDQSANQLRISQIRSLLKEFSGDKNKTAQALGVSRATLYRRLKQFDEGA
ncbi:MAG: sigma-54-dependent Fis family transcriptional regulator [Deltaproteobacteria bacterium]|nr:sigma-54-dependent Fis family transcriptional regulator [Deltaproteobacteria bacterium]